MSQAIYSSIKKLKDYTNGLGWFKKLFFSNELRTALNKLPNDADKFTQEHAFDVYNAFLNKSGGFFNWLGKMFLSGLKAFAEVAFTAKVVGLQKFDQDSFASLFNGQSTPAANAPANANNSVTVTNEQPDAKSLAAADNQADASPAPADAQASSEKPADNKTKAASDSPAAVVHDNPLATKKSADDVLDGLIALDASMKVTHDGDIPGGDLYATVRKVWKSCKDTATAEDKEFHKTVRQHYRDYPTPSSSRALKLLGLVKDFAVKTESRTDNVYATNLMRELELQKVTKEGIAAKLITVPDVDPTHAEEVDYASPSPSPARHQTAVC